MILRKWLAEAEEARQKLSTGRLLVEIRHGQNEYMRFKPADIGVLNAMIDDLRGQLAQAGVTTSGGRTRARRVAF